jgi:hypothetical protein
MSGNGYSGEDEEDGMMSHTFDILDKDKNGKLSYNELLEALEDQKNNSRTVLGLEKLIDEIKMKNFTESQYQLEKDLFKGEMLKVLADVPRNKEHRLQWVKSLNLDAHLATHLWSGVLWDGLLGIKKMSKDDILNACTKFANEVTALVTEEWAKLNDSARGSEASTIESGDRWSEATSQMSKFMEAPGAAMGNYGDESVFHGGLESQLGVADPFILKGILREHISLDDSITGFMPSNYGIYTTPCVEFARLLGDIDLFEFCKIHRESKCSMPSHADCCVVEDEMGELKKIFEVVKKSRNSIFPGDIGDRVFEQRIIFEYTDYIPLSQSYVAQSIKKSMTEYADRTVFKENEDSFRGINVEEQSSSLLITVQLKTAPKTDDRVIQTIEHIATSARKICAGISFSMFSEHRIMFKFIADFPSPLSQSYIVQSIKKSLTEHKDMTDFEKRGYLRRMKVEDQFSSLVITLELKIHPKTDDCVSGVILAIKELIAASANEIRAEMQFSLVDDHWQGQTYTYRANNEGDDENFFEGVHGLSITRHGRLRRPLKELTQIPEVEKAELRLEEAIVQYQYTGPLFQKWNSLLRQIPSRTTSGATDTPRPSTPW